MSTIEPGTPVRVIIEGVYAPTRRWATPYNVQTASGTEFGLVNDPAVQVVPVDPERPLLDRESIARGVFASDWTDSWEEQSELVRREYLRNADAILALIEAAHPGLIR